MIYKATTSNQHRCESFLDMEFIVEPYRMRREKMTQYQKDRTALLTGTIALGFTAVFVWVMAITSAVETYKVKKEWEVVNAHVASR